MPLIRAPLPTALDGERVDRVVAMVCDVPRSAAAELIDGGSVKVDGRLVTRRSERVPGGAEVEVDLPEVLVEAGPQADAGVEFAVVHEDPHLLVVDKPAGLVVHPGAGNPEGTLVHGLLARYPDLDGVGEALRPGIVHRLDRGTSGLLVVARTDEVRARLQAELAARRITRRYRTVVWGHVREPRGVVDAPIARSPRDPTRMSVVVGGRPARTSYEVVARFDEPVQATELVCHLETGRTHQIRVHLRAIDHPVIGDPRYGGARASLPLGRQFLHAEHLAFTHPVTGEALALDSPLPADLAELRARLA